MKLIVVVVLLSFATPKAFGVESDPFAGVVPNAQPAPSASTWRENFGLRKELMSEFATSEHAAAYSRQSAGLELLKKFSSETATIASVDFQGRVVRRDRFVPVLNDLQGMNWPGWAFEYHNAYADLYNVAGAPGAFNLRAGRFYLPFGLNLQTDTHGTLLQLSNERQFGFERDWYAGAWGSIGRELHYDVDYLAGSGYDFKYRGQSGLGAARLSLANRFLSEYGLEGGVSVLGGERLSEEDRVIETQRLGIDGRLRHAIPSGLLTWTTELGGGRDVPDAVFMQLHQAEYLHASRRWGAAAQYRRYWRDGIGFDGSIIAETTLYFQNDVASSTLHWVKLNIERKLENFAGRRDVIVALQYYRYW